MPPTLFVVCRVFSKTLFNLCLVVFIINPIVCITPANKLILFRARGTNVKRNQNSLVQSYNTLVLNVLKQGVPEDALQLVADRVHHEPHPVHQTR